MTLDDLKSAVESARRFTHTIDGRTFTLRTPTEHEIDLSYFRAVASGLEHGGASFEATREVSTKAVIGWTEVMTTDILPSLPSEPLVYSPDAALLLFDAKQEWFDSIKKAVRDRREESKAKTEEAAKN